MPDISETVGMICSSAGVVKPSIYLTELPLPGSFIIGKNMDTTKLVVPGRLFNILDDEELEAALAYNIAQIDEDIFLRTLAALVSGVLTMAASAVRWGAVFTGFGDYDEPAPVLFGSFVMGIVAPPAATIIHSVTHGDPDAIARALNGKTNAFLSAVEKLENSNIRGYPSLGFICQIDPLKENFFEHLFDVHPSRDTRGKKLTAKGENT
jgi:heat shock protein HtpX